MFKRLIRYILILSCSVLTACQPTPDEPVVQNKSDQEMLNIIEQSNDETIVDVPEHYNNSFESTNEQMTVYIDADISMQDSGSCAVYTIKPKELTQADADLILDTFTGDNTLYATNGGTEVITKEHQEEVIVFFERMLAQAETPEAKQELKHMVDYFKIEYDFAQESRYEIPAKTTFSSVFGNQMLRALEFSWNETGTIYGQEGTEEDYLEEKQGLLNSIESAELLSIKGIIDLEGDVEAYIDIRKNNSGKNTSVRYSKYNYKEETLSSFGYPVSEPLPLRISESEAIKLAEDTLCTLGIDYMALTEIHQEKEKHYMKYVRNVDGLLQNEVISCDFDEVNNFRETWQAEYILIMVDDSGIVYFDWRSPSEVVEELTKDVILMDFNEVMSIFEQQMQAEKVFVEPDEKQYITNREFYIDRIELNSMTIAKLDNRKEYYTVPVWDFFGHEVVTYCEDYNEYVLQNGGYNLDENNKRIVENDKLSYVTINAIDGTCINRTIGY